MQIKNIMVSDVISVSPDTSLPEVVDMIFSNRFHGVPVVEKGKVIGIITEDDFFLKNYDDLYLPTYIRFIRENKIAGNLPPEVKEKIGKLLKAKAEDLMTVSPTTVSPEMDAEELMNLIKKTKFITFPVVDENKNLVGIVTLADILGTVKQGSKEMKKAMRGEREIEGITKELDIFWKDELIFISRKRVKTWKGIFFIAVIAALGIAVLLSVNLNSKTGCELEKKTVYPIECQRFIYSEWNACQPDGTQTREVKEKLPKNCEGGAPEIIRPCQ